MGTQNLVANHPSSAEREAYNARLDCRHLAAAIFIHLVYVLVPVARKANTLATFTTVSTAEFTCNRRSQRDPRSKHTSAHETLLVNAILK